MKLFLLIFKLNLVKINTLNLEFKNNEKMLIKKLLRGLAPIKKLKAFHQLIT
jgi:hypothetical protein